MTGKQKLILIGCPQYDAYIRGTYACEQDGRMPRGDDGQFYLERVRCGQRGGRCMQTLCALHRYNRRGPGTWYPDRLRPRPPADPPARRGPEPSPDSPPPLDGGLSIQV